MGGEFGHQPIGKRAEHVVVLVFLLALARRARQADADDGWRRTIFQVIGRIDPVRSEEHTSELQSLMSNSYAVSCLNKKYPLNHCRKLVQLYLQIIHTTKTSYTTRLTNNHTT